MAGSKLERLRQFLPFLGVGLAVLSVLVGVIFWVQRGAHLELKGSIGRVRTLGLPDGSTVAVLDFRITNQADYPFVVKKVEVLLDTPEGKTLEGAVAADQDTASLFQYYPLLGPRYNPNLLVRTRIEPRESLDRMLAVRLETPEQEVQRRRRLRVRIQDVDGAISEIKEERP